ncbi:MFS transporter [Microbispora corallina]|uniref:MFS transporter n=1 Tax=Microbispora corallina TaxID=83302 RepID=A0ABQ4FSX8_9ACTN|nr:MFS transporter [Microbispora corallina]GIH37866.1 MFS transporter [Microbispora corallina]
MTTADPPAAGRGGRRWTRDFRLVWAGETISLLGGSVAAVSLPLVAVVTLHAGTLATGLLTAAAWLPWLLVGLPAGAWVDRLQKRPLMLACDLCAAAVFATVPIAAWAGTLTMTHLIVAAAAGGVAQVFFTLAYRAYLPVLVGPERLLHANTRLQGSESAAGVAGPGLAGILAQAFGAVSGVLADAASFVVSAVCLLCVRTREPRPARGARRRLPAEIRDGLRFVAHDRYLRALAVFSAMSNISLMGYQPVRMVYLARDAGAGPGAIGVVLALAGVGGVTGAALAGRIAGRFGTARGFLLCEAFAAPMLLLGPIGGGLAWFAAGGFGAGMGIVASNILTGTFRQRYSPAGLFGRITASTAALNYGAIPLGGLLGGTLGELIGVRETLVATAGLAILSVGVLLLGPFRPLRDFPGPARRDGLLTGGALSPGPSA